jgi:ferredoxin, 2Fe-2S
MAGRSGHGLPPNDANQLTMPTVHVTDRKGEQRTIESQEGYSVMQVIRDSGFGDIAALCAGGCSCSTCHVYVDSEFIDRIPPMENEENELLDITGCRRENSRLSCQIRFVEALNGLRVTVAPED